MSPIPFCRRRGRALFVLVAAILALAALPSCSTVQVTQDQIGEFRLGELQVLAASDFANAYAATKEAMEDQGLFLTGDDRQPGEAVLTARDRRDAQVTVKLQEVAAGQTRVRIRYGLTGDASRSQALYREILERL